MDERRYVVDISRPLDSELVAAASQAIASRLEMEPERIRTLLAGRVGAVTRPVLHEKAVLIARVFSDVGVAVTIREVILEADPVVEPPIALESQLDQPGASQSGEAAAAEPEPEPEPDLTPVPDPEPPRPDLDGIWDDDSGWDSEQEVVAPWNVVDEGDGQGPSQERVDYRAYPDARGDLGMAELDVDLVEPAPDDEPDDRPSATRGAEAPVAEALVAEAPQEARPPPPQPWRKSHGVSVRDSGAEEEAARRTLSSTRWVPSPHDQSEPERTFGASATEGWDEGAEAAKATGDTGRWWVPQRAPVQDAAAPTPDSPPLRNYLIWALFVSVVVLIVLQVLFALRAPEARAGDYLGGLAAYREGDFASARRVWEPLATAGDARAQFMLGHMVQNGQGQPWSNARAADWYRQAAQQGLPEAQVALADLYLRGMGVPPDAQVASQWLARAAQAGNAQAQVAFGELLMHGVGVEQDFAQALGWFQSAAAAGFSEAVDLLDFVVAAGPLLSATEPGQAGSQ